MCDIFHDDHGAFTVNRRTRQKEYKVYVNDLSNYGKFWVPLVAFYYRVGYIVDVVSVGMVLGEPTMVIRTQDNQQQLWVLPDELKEWVHDHEKDSRFPCKVNFYRCGYDGDATAVFMPAD